MVSILLVNLKILYKKYGLLGLRGWWVKSNIIADGSINKALRGNMIQEEPDYLNFWSFCLLQMQIIGERSSIEFHQQSEETKGINNTWKPTGSL